MLVCSLLIPTLVSAHIFKESQIQILLPYKPDVSTVLAGPSLSPGDSGSLIVLPIGATILAILALV